MSKNQTIRIAELEAKIKVYEDLIAKSNFAPMVIKDEIGFKVKRGYNGK